MLLLELQRGLSFAMKQTLYIEISKPLVFFLMQATMGNFLILGWRGMDQRVIKVTSPRESWGRMVMQLQNMSKQVHTHGLFGDDCTKSSGVSCFPQRGIKFCDFFHLSAQLPGIVHPMMILFVCHLFSTP